jgi:G:T/U-mismatch repair DNA glycosylase
VKRPVLIAVAVIAFLAVSALVARWLNDDTVERARVVELLRAQARGDAAAMLRVVRCRDASCVAVVRADARRLRGRGDVKIALYQSQTAHALRSRTKPTRVVWFTPGRLTTVQCVLVRRTGNVFAGVSVTLLRISAPIGRESSCP